jgi:dihydropyrimidinase
VFSFFNTLSKSDMSYLIQHGRIVTATDNYVADLWIEGERIVAIGDSLPIPDSANVIDARGKFVFPGFIDPHVHIYLPFMGTYAKDDYASASRAAIVGGTTTLIEMCCPNRMEDPWDAFQLWKSKAVGVSACDFTFHMAVSRFDDQTEDQLRRIVDEGISSFKVFLAYKGFFGVDDAELFRTLRLANELGVVVTAHCENETIVAELQKQLLSEGKTGPEWHEPSRPMRVEAEGVQHLMSFAEITGAEVYIVHTSNSLAVQAALEGRRRGVRVSIETVIPYLVLDASFAARPDFEGAKYVMSPPIREASQQALLWQSLRNREINTVATDHAPFDFHGQKEMGRDDFTKIPNGIPTVEDRVNLLYTYGVNRGQLDLNTFVDVASTQAAKIFGLFPRKGTIAVGADADVVIYDPEYRGTISANTHLMATDYSAFEGWALEGRPSYVFVRGKLQAHDGKFIGQLGHGQFLARTPRA